MPPDIRNRQSRCCLVITLVVGLLATLDSAAQENKTGSLTADRIAWSPDGNKLAFGATWDGDEEIYIANVDGSNLIQITYNDRTDTSVIFSADGESLIYVSAIQRDENQADFDVFTVGIGGGDPKFLYGTAGRSEQWPLLMADGRLSVSVRTEPGVIKIMAVDLLSGAEETLIESGTRDGWGSFSRDGKKVVYSSTRIRGGWTFDIFVANVNGSEDRHLKLFPSSAEGFGSVYPDFFPDGESFVYRSDKDGDKRGDNSHYVYDLRTAREERLPRPDGAVLGQPTVSPDGKTIAFSTDYDGLGAQVITLMDAQTKRGKRLIFPKADVQPPPKSLN